MTTVKLQGFAFGATELKNLTDWPFEVREDYLLRQQDVVTISEAINNLQFVESVDGVTVDNSDPLNPVIDFDPDEKEDYLGLPSVSGQVLVSTDDGERSWKTLSLSGGEVVKNKGNISGTNFANIEADIVWASYSIPSTGSPTNVSVSGADITINTTGTYKFTVNLRVEGDGRVELLVRTYIDAGAGYVQDADEINSNYALRDTDQDTGATTLTTILELNAGDKIKFTGEGDADGTCTGLNPGTVLLVEEK